MQKLIWNGKDIYITGNKTKSGGVEQTFSSLTNNEKKNYIAV